MCLLVASSCDGAGGSRTAPSGNDAVFRYRGADRDARLVERAKREGTLVSTRRSRPPSRSRSPRRSRRNTASRWSCGAGCPTRSSSGRSPRRGRGGTPWMWIETNGPEMEMLAREKLLGEIHSPYLADLPAGRFPRIAPGFPIDSTSTWSRSTRPKCSAPQIPATYEGFVDPKWKGRIAVEATDAEWMATIVKTWGDDKGTAYFRKLSALRPDVRTGHILLANLVVAGEVPVALTAIQQQHRRAQAQGRADRLRAGAAGGRTAAGHRAWRGTRRIRMRPCCSPISSSSPEGQRLFESMGRVPASNRVKSELNNFPFTTIDPATVLDEKDKWEKLWNDLFLGSRGRPSRTETRRHGDGKSRSSVRL